jgi:crotonobetainyl-CoA:carnitine CoA-transferase CaiB-like acyl-CoA transferase
MASNNMPLSRFKVIDLCRARAGPTCVRQLADWGADTIKVEMPEGGIGVDDSETRLGFDFFNIHRNKRSMTLNLKSKKGKEILFKMVKEADVVVENFRPGVKHRLGIDYDVMRKINPRIVYGSISGFGQEGPYSGRAGLDQIAQGIGGIMSVTGLPGQGPVRVGIPMCDLTSGLLLAQGILMALLEREVSGKGQWVHTSLTEAMIQLMDLQAARYLNGGDVPKQMGNNHPTGVPTGVFKCSDGLINIQAATPHLFKRMCTGLGVPAMADKPEYKELSGRQKNRDKCNAAIEKVTKTKTMEHWITLFAEVGVPCGPIYSVDQTFADPQVKTLNMDPTVTHPKLGKVHLVGQAVKMARTPQKMRMPTPDFGQHTDKILAKLGYSKADIKTMRTNGDV